MQGINPPTPAQLLAAGQVPLMKFEIEVGAGNWIDLCALGAPAKNYVEDFSISLGGASPTPNPIGGSWSVTLFNEDGIFHPDHGGGYAAYCVTGRKVRISVGAVYAGTDRIWQRIIGYMDEPKFSIPDYKVTISGQDYMKRLEDAEFQELDATFPNHWGLSTTFDSWPSNGLLGDEMYTNHDAMDTADEGEAGFHNVTNWVETGCTFDAIDEAGKHVGRMTGADAGPPSFLTLPDIGTNAEIGKTYKVKFKHRIVDGDGSIGLLIQISQAALIKQVLYWPTDEWAEETLLFDATGNAAIQIRFVFEATAFELWLDDISVWKYVYEEERIYDLTAKDANQKGPYHVTLDGNPVQQGEEDEGWWYDEAAGHLFFDRNKPVADGTGTLNVEVFYYRETDPEDAVARILYFAKVCDPTTGLPYVDEAEAKTAMENDDPGWAIEKVWFKAGSTFLSAIRMLCEVCDYRFYFKYDGTPVFKARPAPGGPDFIFTSPAHIATINTYQSRSEIKNRVIIKGIKLAEPVNRDESSPSNLKGEAHNDASITAYGERTLTITNYLFQHQARLSQMCIDLVARYKDPKWYGDLEIPFNPVPLELADDIQWEERLSHIQAETQTGAIRDIKITKFNTTYKCEKP